MVEALHTRLDVGQHGRREEGTAAILSRRVDVGTADEQLSTLRDAGPHLLGNILGTLLVHQGTVVLTVLLLGHLLNNLLFECRLHRLVDDNSLRGAAHLASVGHAGVHDSSCGEVQISILQHSVRVASTKLDDALLQETAGFAGDFSAGDFGSCESHTLYQVVLHDVRGRGNVRDDGSEEALGEIWDLLHHVLEQQCAAKAVRSMLQHNCVASHQCWDAHSDGLPHGEIPGHDGKDDAQRLVSHIRLRKSRQSRVGGVIKEIVAILRVPIDKVCAFLNLGNALSNWFAHLHLHQLSCFFLSISELVCQSRHNVDPVAGGDFSPLLEGRGGVCDDLVDLLLRHLCVLLEHFAGLGVDLGEGRKCPAAREGNEAGGPGRLSRSSQHGGESV
mmetsp:Transcript_25746/g.55977  ORF Transcript_25746/g.55977 Transcript_25746/m.55977 type:complete len:389 (+) Transcript_25746:549-1715(+)